VYLKPKKLGAIVLNDAAKFVITDILVHDGECLLDMPDRITTHLSKLPYHPAAGKAEIYNFASSANQYLPIYPSAIAWVLVTPGNQISTALPKFLAVQFWPLIAAFVIVGIVSAIYWRKEIWKEIKTFTNE